tara:strand:+ start:439 stop:759 length:321 start_codon:yes stop_codon:yes gene_type:complete
MNFKLIISSYLTNEKHYSYKLAFLPEPIWIKDDKKIKANSGPHYKEGGIKALLDNQKLNQYFNNTNKYASLVIDNSKCNNGFDFDLNLKNLLNDLRKTGFKIKIYQ